MDLDKINTLVTERLTIKSLHLQRPVIVDCYMPSAVKDPAQMSLLFINDGQNMEELGLEAMLESLIGNNEIEPVFCVAIHAGEDRKMEYGTAGLADYKGRGAKAGEYCLFVFEELLPLLRTTYNVPEFRDKSFAGFSLGALSALDIVWCHPHEFTKVGIFSGSFWWRTKSLDEDYVESRDKIMHARIRDGEYYPWLSFFIETGWLDETMDRNHNGVIDSIDDALELIDEFVAKGYSREKDIFYLELPDGRHDIPTWARAMPEFLRWGFGRLSNNE